MPILNTRLNSVPGLKVASSLQSKGSSIQRWTHAQGGIYEVIFKAVLFFSFNPIFLPDKWKEKKVAKGNFLLVPTDAKYLFSFHLTLININL